MAIEAVDTRARGLRNRREAEALGLGGVLRRLDWVLLVALAGVVGYGLWAIDGITKHDVGGSAASRQALYAARRRARLRGRRSSSTPTPTGASAGRSTSGRSG